MTSFNAIAPIKAALLARPDMAYCAIDTLYRMFKGSIHGELVAQMLQTEMIQLLLGALEGKRITVDGNSVCIDAVGVNLVVQPHADGMNHLALLLCIMAILGYFLNGRQ